MYAGTPGTPQPYWGANTSSSLFTSPLNQSTDEPKPSYVSSHIISGGGLVKPEGQDYDEPILNRERPSRDAAPLWGTTEPRRRAPLVVSPQQPQQQQPAQHTSPYERYTYSRAGLESSQGGETGRYLTSSLSSSTSALPPASFVDKESAAKPPMLSIYDVVGRQALPPSFEERETANEVSGSTQSQQGQASATGSGENWITVFGFPPNSATYFLKIFQEFGDVIHHEMPPGANWMHLQYDTRLQAHKALARNGKIYTDTMIGVIARTALPPISTNEENAPRTRIYNAPNPDIAVVPTGMQLPSAERTWWGQFSSNVFGW